MSTAASFSLNLPRYRISSKSSPPLQILTALFRTKLYLLRHQVVALLIFKELVHLHDVRVILNMALNIIKDDKNKWPKQTCERHPLFREYQKNTLVCILGQTYNFSKNVDLVEKHALLVVVHVAFSKNLHSSLSSGFSVDAHTHFAKSAWWNLVKQLNPYLCPELFQFCKSSLACLTSCQRMLRQTLGNSFLLRPSNFFSKNLLNQWHA